jgi:BlaI family transcriptional regulator, penicillinase repressor
MTKKPLPRPTEAELEMLRVLWERGPSTVREIHENLGDQKETGYTTTLKILQKMAEKGLVARDESQRSHVYRAVYQAEQTQRQLVRDLLRRAFGGAPGKLVVQALSEEAVSADDLAEIRRLLDELEARQSRKGTK